MAVIPTGASPELFALLRTNVGATVTVIPVVGSPVTGVLDSINGNLIQVTPPGAPPVYLVLNYIVQVTVETT
ncbi:MAG: hypothetical protein HPY58_03895 [Firmicutes bacterium]|nr:hypothetical protein [Bacillota bacterium]